MSVGIKEPCGDFTQVTGTIKMLSGQKNGVSKEAADDKPDTMKQTKKGIILTPQPSEDPNDPLNWPLWHRDVILAVIGIFSFLSGGLVGLLAPAMGTIQAAMHDTAMLTTIGVNGMIMIGLAVGDFFLGGVARVFAKRPVYICAVPVLFGGLIWCANAASYYELVVSRLMQGLGAAPAECLVSATVGEIYFVHERGFRLALYTLLYLGGKNLWPTIAGFIVSDLHSWHWVFWIAAIIAGTLWVLLLVFVHETTYKRSEPSKPQSGQENKPQIIARGMLTPAHTRTLSRVSDLENIARLKSEKRPFYKGLKVFSGRRSREPFLRILTRPLILYAYPPVLFATVLYASSVVWLSIIAETISSIFSEAPYEFSQRSVGLLYVAIFIGGALGSAGGGKLMDFVVKRMCRRNNGWFEPEFRLIMVPVVMIAMTIGLMGFGWSTYDKSQWIVPTIFLGILGFGTSLACTIAIQYALDCFRELSIECLISLNVLKNVLGFVFSCFVPQFLHASGDRTPFIVYGSICVVICMFALPMYYYGKVCRRFAETHDWVHLAEALANR